MQNYALMPFQTYLSVALIATPFLYNLNTLYRTLIYGRNHDIKTWLLADLSGYFVIGRDSSMYCKDMQVHY